MRTAPALLERERELAMLIELLDDPGHLAIVEGPAGIGKSSLIAALLEEARSRGVRVLSARGSELERDHPFGIARQLFEPALAQLDDVERELVLRGAAELAAPVAWPAAAGADATGAASSPDRLFSVLHGLYWLTVNLTARGPLVLVVDDLHWADEPSLRWIAYAAHRIEDLAVPVMLGRRTNEPGPHEAVLDALREQSRARVVTPGPLTLEATTRLIEGVYDADVAGEFAHACHEHGGGNPLVLRELARALRDDRVAPDAASAARVAGVAPASVARAVLSRLGRLPASVRAVAGAAAILDQEATIDRAAALAGVEAEDAIDAADELVRAEIFESSMPIRFRHPLLLTAVRQDIPAGRRASLHRRAAEVLVGGGAAEAEVALHLLASARVGAPWAAQLLLRQGREAMARGAHAAAERLLLRAIAEPLEPLEHARALIDLGIVAHLLGRDEALDHLEQALEAAPDSSTLALALLHYSELSLVCGRQAEAERLADRVLAGPAATDAEVRMVAEVARALAAYHQRRGDLEPYERLLQFEGVRGTTYIERVLLICLASYRSANAIGSADETAALAERVVASIPDDEMKSSPLAVLPAAVVLIESARWDRAREVLERASMSAREHAAPQATVFISVVSVALHMITGHMREAETDALLAQAAAEETGLKIMPMWLAGHQARAAAERGDFAAARHLLEELGLGAEPPPAAAADGALRVRGRLRFLEGRIEEALADALLVGERVLAGQRSGIGNPWRSDAAEALVRLGRNDEALEIARDEYEEFLRWHPLFAATSLRALALATGGREGIALLRGAVEQLEPSPLRFDAARALVELGAALRRDKQRSEARTTLERGMDLAHRCGGILVAERARAELATLGTRPRGLARTGYDSLTASERRVAEMAAQGLSNPEIAQALFITRKTVEKHLGSVYWKLSIKSRDQIADALTT